MGKSILGQSFDEFVAKQLDIRTRIYSGTEDDFIAKGNLAKENLQYSIANSSFLRMSSAVNIETLEKAMFFGKADYMDNGLAKSFILQGGTLTSKQEARPGLSSYQVGSREDFGYRPMPGIVSMKISSKGRWGTLREASVNIKCFNRDQLSIVEALYLRPGYTVLLEWGNSLFYDNKFNLVNNIKFLDFFSDNKSLNDLHQEILTKREQYSGNYDAFIGPVVNFNIKHNSDGTYDCTSKVVTWGTIIESLKITTTAKANSPYSNLPKVQQEEVEGLGWTVEKSDPEALDDSHLESILNVIYKTCNKGKIVDTIVSNISPGENIYINDIYGKYYDMDPLGNAIIKPAVGIDTKRLTTFTIIPFVNSYINSKTNVEDISSRKRNLHVYMSLGSLLSIISKNCLLYAKNDTSLININFNTEENLCYSHEYQISLDPNICLIKYNSSEFKALGLDKNVINGRINELLPVFKKSSEVGYIMNIMVNIQHIIEIIEILRSNDKSVNLFDFLNKLMEDINKSLGSINQFNVGYDNDTNTLIITDNQILDSETDKTLKIINTTGLKSAVREMTIDSKLSNQLSSMIAIGAQASSNVATGIDSSVFQQYNEGLKDRFFPIKKDVTNNSLPEGEYKKSLDTDPRAQEISKLITNIYVNQKIIQDNIETSKGYYNEIIKSLKVKSKSSTGIIPFTYTLKMNGLSGINYGQLFSIEPNRLPKNYLNPNNPNQPLVAFIVTSVENSIENNSWVTSISGQVAPIRNLKVK